MNSLMVNAVDHMTCVALMATVNVVHICVCVCITYMLMEYTHKGYVGECREVSVQVDCVCAHYRRCSVRICLLDFMSPSSVLLRVFGRLRTYMKVLNVILNVFTLAHTCMSIMVDCWGTVQV